MKKVLMHVCCAPCFITIQEDIEQNGMLIDGKREKVDMTAYWYNPNIHPKAGSGSSFLSLKIRWI